MAKKIIGGIGSLLGIKKKKEAAPAAVAEQKGPIVKPLGGSLSATVPAVRRRRATLSRPGDVSDRLGG